MLQLHDEARVHVERCAHPFVDYPLPAGSPLAAAPYLHDAGAKRPRTCLARSKLGAPSCAAGPSWPFETSKVITAGLHFLRDYDDAAHHTDGAIDAEGLWALLAQYALAHTDAHAVNSTAWLLPGLGASWIGESLHPDDGYWLSRAKMYAADHPHRNRGHRYLHSTFCDLVIGMLGVRPSTVAAMGTGAKGSVGGAVTLVVKPLLPVVRLGLRYFAVDGLRIHGHDLCVAYDADGSRYGLGVGLHVLIDGALVKSGALGKPLAVELAPRQKRT